ncbi:CBS domain-containing protein [Streptomyces scabiei]|uniref:CBS domain-containing protein n=1 Tax=Streptomyces scabiei TaxID=1930 RepID=UPI0029901CCD|nr:CBS domain-containing protein [Streptomyces scabiei]MDW8805369.1 CBS domain-containing protein [Streptomyces scabiei]
MTSARDVMHTGAECVGEHETLDAAARRMRDLDVGALPICGDDNKLHGIITDRDIVVKCLAADSDPKKTATGELAQHCRRTSRRRTDGPRRVNRSYGPPARAAGVDMPPEKYRRDAA